VIIPDSPAYLEPNIQSMHRTYRGVGCYWLKTKPKTFDF
jgi:hypothetical protein